MVILGPGSPNSADPDARALRAVLPESVCAAFAAADDDPGPLFADEEVAVANAAPSRRREFALGRRCARRALAALGVNATAIPVGRDRAPCWPPGIVGSITHCAGFVGAVVATKHSMTSIGFDAEPATPLDQGAVRVVCTPAEIAWLRRVQLPAAADWPKVLFCAKEAIHKCIAPLSGTTLYFGAITVTIDPRQHTFSAEFSTPDRGRGQPDLASVTGRLALTGDFVFAVAYIKN